MRLLVATALILSTIPGIAAAQMCRGGMSSDWSPVRVAGAFEDAPNERRYGASLAYVRRAFVSAAISNVWSKVHRPGEAWTWYGGEAGYSLRPRRALELCPLATFQSENGPVTQSEGDFGVVRTSSQGRRSAGLGLALGGSVYRDDDVDLIPFANALFVVSRQQWSVEEAGTELGGHQTHRHGATTAGVGIVVRNSVTVIPFVSQLHDSEYFGLEKVRGVRVVLNVGRASRKR